MRGARPGQKVVGATGASRRVGLSTRGQKRGPAAVQHVHLGMPQPAQQPPRPRGVEALPGQDRRRPPPAAVADARRRPATRPTPPGRAGDDGRPRRLLAPGRSGRFPDRRNRPRNMAAHVGDAPDQRIRQRVAAVQHPTCGSAEMFQQPSGGLERRGGRRHARRLHPSPAAENRHDLAKTKNPPSADGDKVNIAWNAGSVKFMHPVRKIPAQTAAVQRAPRQGCMERVGPGRVLPGLRQTPLENEKSALCGRC